MKNERIVSQRVYTASAIVETRYTQQTRAARELHKTIKAYERNDWIRSIVTEQAFHTKYNTYKSMHAHNYIYFHQSHCSIYTANKKTVLHFDFMLSVLYLLSTLSVEFSCVKFVYMYIYVLFLFVSHFARMQKHELEFSSSRAFFYKLVQKKNVSLHVAEKIRM